jgi:hypothetical protein
MDDQELGRNVCLLRLHDGRGDVNPIHGKSPRQLAVSHSLTRIIYTGRIDSAVAILQETAWTRNRNRVFRLGYRRGRDEYHHRGPHPAIWYCMGFQDHRNHRIGFDVSCLMDVEGESTTEEGVIL